VAHRLKTNPVKVLAWEDGEAHPNISQLRKMAAAYRRLLSDFYLPRPPEEDPLPHDFRRLPGQVAFRYSKALRYQLRLARQRRALALNFAAELCPKSRNYPHGCVLTTILREQEPHCAASSV
jgi:hypothetical protein